MSDRDAYTALVCSLPNSERLFIAKKPPLSRLRLDSRLKALTVADAEVLARLEHVLSWNEYAVDITDAVALKRVRDALKVIRQPALRKIVHERMEMRTAMSALRLRRDGLAPPAGAFGCGRWARHIPAHWTESCFGLGAALPWLKEAQRLIESDDPLALERHLLDTSYLMLKRHAARHQFDFEAVAIYVLIWNIFDRWAQSDASAAARRFEILAHAAMAQLGDIRFEGEPA
ncbi:hypothetical protein Q8W25_18865 [Shimia thalassica]|uniref:hypothetical protein n=1 Tax=Shimia thalassica TaxID=1715693 RepID=UPI0027327CD9|nr:hypothetical protein [Shimia thalassica]MDP2496099.1 hypothetical protein [Shimia thalassica]